MADLIPWRFYVYDITVDDVTVYVGKGSGYRLSAQKSKYKCDGHEVARFKRERDAYAYEVVRIAEVHPVWNKHPGGNGSRATPVRRRTYKWDRECAALEREFGEGMGTRVMAARTLLRYDISPYMAPSMVEKIRQVANGCRA